MGGENPYLKSPKAGLPQKKFKITFQPSGQVVEVDPANLPASGTGQPGSILDVALAHDIDIEHACGGVVACSTCHVYVKEGLSSCNAASEEEEDMLDEAPGVTPKSRLACQAVGNGSQNLVVEFPSLRRNLVREGK